MNFIPTDIEGSYGISSSTKVDSRGTLTRLWEIDSHLRHFNLVQSSLVNNPMIGTLRGLHFQANPFSENKVIECLSGRILDVVVDLREESRTSGSYMAIEIGFDCEFLGIFIPAGCAHGYMTLETNSTLIYFMDKEYSPEHSKGIRWNDPHFGIRWPSAPRLISERDSNWPSYIP